jgi:uncharacterized protein
MKLICTLLLALLIHGQALALTIATGSREGTYFKIAQDIKELAEKEGIPVEIVETNGSFDNIKLLSDRKVDLAIMQLDVLRIVAEIIRKETGLNVLQEAKIVLNLYLEEIHVIAKSPDIKSLEELQGKRVAVGPEKSGSALTAEVLLTGFGLTVNSDFSAPDEAVKKLQAGEIDALIFVGGAPVPAFAHLDRSFHFVALPMDSGLEQIYPKKKIEKTVYGWADAFDTHAVPSVIMTRNRLESDYATTLEKLVLLILLNKEYLDSRGHPKWKDSFLRSTFGEISYRPAMEMIQIYNFLDKAGYRIIKK